MISRIELNSKTAFHTVGQKMIQKKTMNEEAKNDKASRCCSSAYQKKIRRNGIKRNEIRRNATQPSYHAVIKHKVNQKSNNTSNITYFSRLSHFYYICERKNSLKSTCTP